MVILRATAITLSALALCAALPGCGKKEEAKTAAQVQAEKDATAKAVRTNALTATPMSGLDKANTVQGPMDKQAEETNKKIDADSK